MGAFLYLSLFAASSAGTLADDLLDKKLGTALLSSIAYLSGFLAVLQWTMPGIGYQTIGLAASCVLGCVWDVWSCCRSTLSARKIGADEADAETIGALLMLGARMPAYAYPALLALDWIS